MERWERERILGEWGVRDGTARSQAERRALDAEIEHHPLRGKPLRQRVRNFRLEADSYIASLGGPLPYMRRLREIHEQTAAAEAALEAAWLELAASCRGDAAAFARSWRASAERWSFEEVNDLIDRHNRYYPVEARLPMDPKTGDFVHVGGEPYRRARLDSGWVLERFPPELPAAAPAA